MILRAAQPTDAGTVGEILGDFAASTPWMPKLHSGAEDVAHAGYMIDQGWVTVACDEVGIFGFIARDGAQVHALFTSTRAKGLGVGKVLLDHAKGQSEILRLYTFAANAGARRFYRREGFVEVGQGDGSGNEEGLPDVSLLWERKAANAAIQAKAKAPDRAAQKVTQVPAKKPETQKTPETST